MGREGCAGKGRWQPRSARGGSVRHAGEIVGGDVEASGGQGSAWTVVGTQTLDPTPKNHTSPCKIPLSAPY